MQSQNRLPSCRQIRYISTFFNFFVLFQNCCYRKVCSFFCRPRDLLLYFKCVIYLFHFFVFVFRGWAHSVCVTEDGKVYRWGWLDDVKTTFTNANMKKRVIFLFEFQIHSLKYATPGEDRLRRALYTPHWKNKAKYHTQNWGILPPHIFSPSRF